MKKNKNGIVMGFWKKLPKNAKLLAPMADVTDAPFREIVARYSRMGKHGGGPDVLYTEFVAADGLFSEEGRSNLMYMLKYNRKYRPIVAQIFSSNPEKMEEATRLCVKLGFDGIDLNMGCPERNITKQGAGSAMIQTPKLAQDIIYAAKRGAGNIPISVKTRIGWTQNEIETWIPILLETDIAAIILHGRTRKQMSKTPADWDIIARAGEIVRESGKPTKFIGNGDVSTIEQADEYIERYNVDGIMIGRGVFGRPWLFDSQCGEISVEKKLNIMLEHTRLFLKILPNENFNVIKKHYKAYISGFDGAKELRINCMKAENYRDVEQYVYKFLGRKKNLFSILWKFLS